MNVVASAGIPLRTNAQYKIMHDKVIITDGANVELGSYKGYVWETDPSKVDELQGQLALPSPEKPELRVLEWVRERRKMKG